MHCPLRDLHPSGFSCGRVYDTMSPERLQSRFLIAPEVQEAAWPRPAGLSVRRFHDQDTSGWALFSELVPSVNSRPKSLQRTEGLFRAGAEAEDEQGVRAAFGGLSDDRGKGLDGCGGQVRGPSGRFLRGVAQFA